MQAKIRSLFILTAVLALTLATVLPARADDELPPDAAADTATLRRVWDVAPGTTSSDPFDMVVYNGSLYFAADGNNGYGRELWQLGNPTVININPGAAGSNPSYMTVYNSRIYFGADGGDGAGQELWSFDWTNGAQRVEDIYPGAIGSNPLSMAVYNNVLYFCAVGNDGAGYELWRYDPVNGAQRAADIASGATGSFPIYLVVYNNELYFNANGNDGAGPELWKYNPTDGAQRVVDIYPGTTGSDPWFLSVYSNAIYFSAIGDNGTGRELWKYDPTNGPQLVADIAYGPDSSLPYWLRAYNGALYFSQNYQLWRYDPVNGADPVLAPGCSSASFNPQGLAVYDNALYFNANCNDGAGKELWKYNNTALAIFRPAKSYDGWVLESAENSNVGGFINPTSPVLLLGDDAQDKQYRSILSFDTSSLPDSAVIISATLRIHQQGISGTNPFTTHGNILVDITKDSFSNNNILQSTDFQAAPGKMVVGFIKNLPDLNNWFSSLLAKTAFPYLNKTGVTQLRLRFKLDDNNDNGADFLRFFSADAASFSDYPVLEVKYYIP